MNINSKKILVVAAHPDDEILGCGGTISKLSKKGYEIRILILGEGITSRQQERNPDAAEKLLMKLHSEVSKAAKIVGAKSATVLNFPDNRFDGVDLLEIIKEIEKVKNEFKPEIIFTHHPYDLNVDHRVTFNAVITASRPLQGESVKEIYSFEIPSSTEWQYQNSINSFHPQCFFSLSKTDITKKIKAMEVYSGEKRKYPHPRSSQALLQLAGFRGTQCGNNLAESFEIIRFVNEK